MVEIYRSSFRFYLSSLPALLGLMALLETLVWYLEPKNPSFSFAMAFLFIFYQFHRHFLFGENSFAWAKPSAWVKPSADAPPQKFGWFWLISLALILVPVGLALAFAFWIAPGNAPRSTHVGLMVIALVPLYLLSLSLFGTALPASVARPGNFSMSAGIRACFGTMWRLVLGPGVVQILIYGLIIGLDSLLRDVPAYQSATGQLAANTVASTLSLLPSLLGVAVLCHMYQKVMDAQAEKVGQRP